ncbi:MAG: transposase, partial [Deltaproteobacteria bacterium]|nr:transposase [Deltaproteobacteria bacterium]
FQTKNEIAIEMLESALANGVQASWVGADGAFGHDTKFLDSTPDNLRYFACVHSTDTFYPSMPEMFVPTKKDGPGRKPTKLIFTVPPQSAKDIVNNSDVPWTPVEYGIGSKGVMTGEEKLIRVLDIRKNKPNNWVWLHARKLSNGEIKYAISNAPEDTPLSKFTEVATMRWPIEQCFEECKSQLGMSQFEGRSWKGFHRHLNIVFVAHLFIQMMRLKYSVKVDQLTGPGKLIFKAMNMKDPENVPVFTVSQMCKLVVCSLSKERKEVIKELTRIAYIVKSYAMAFVSKCKEVYENMIPIKNDSS